MNPSLGWPDEAHIDRPDPQPASLTPRLQIIQRYGKEDRQGCLRHCLLRRHIDVLTDTRPCAVVVSDESRCRSGSTRVQVSLWDADAERGAVIISAQCEWTPGRHHDQIAIRVVHLGTILSER